MEAAQKAGLSDGETFTLADFSYANSVVAERMFHYLDNTDFLGITVCNTYCDSHTVYNASVDKIMVIYLVIIVLGKCAI